MPIGPGKYDDACTVARHLTRARGVVLIVVEGDKGYGFSVQAEGVIPPSALAEMLRNVANEIERSVTS